MTTSEFPSENSGSAGVDGRVPVLAAAELLRAWIHTQRASWTDAKPYVDLTAHSGQAAVAALPAVALPGMPLRSDATAAFERQPEADPALVQGSTDSLRMPIPKRARVTLPLPGDLLKWMLRGAVAAAVALSVIGASWVLRTYWARLKPAPNVGTAVLESDPPGATVLIDGAAVGTTPMTAELAPGKHVVDFRRRGVTRTIPIEILKGKSTSTRVEWTVRRVGKIHVQSEPSGAKVLIDGKDRGVTPITVDELPAGAHTLVLQSGAGTLQRNVTVAEDKTTEVNEAIFSGWLHVSSPIELSISDGDKGVSLDDRNQALLRPGGHTIRFVNRALGFNESRKIEIRPGETTSLSIVPPPSLLSVNASEPAEVLIDGERAGDTPLTDFPVAIGTREITIKSATTVRRLTVTVTVEPAHLEIDFSKPQP